MKIIHVLIATACAIGSLVDAQVPAHQVKQINEAAPSKGQVVPKKPRRVLIWNTPAHLMDKDPHKGYCIPYGAVALEAIGKKSAAYQPVVSDDLSMFLPENIRHFDAIVMNNASGPWITPTAEDLAKDSFKNYGDKAAAEQVLRKSFLDYVNNGGGVVLLHYAIAANPQWPEFKDFCGGKFTGHPWNEDVGVTVEEPTHPVVAAFGGKDFRIADEIYEYGPPFDRANLRVLLSIDPARSNMGPRWMNRKDGDFALAWVRKIGRGRVFNTSFGHRTEVFWDPRILRFYLDAIQFATGDLDAPTEPRGDRPVRNIPGSEPVPGLDGFVKMFNGKDLIGWEGDTSIWKVVEAARSAARQLQMCG